MTQKCSAPASMRKQPDIFCFTLGMRTAFANVVDERHGRVADEEQDSVGVQAEAAQQISGDRLFVAFTLPGCCAVSRWIASPSRTKASRGQCQVCHSGHNLGIDWACVRPYVVQRLLESRIIKSMGMPSSQCSCSVLPVCCVSENQT